MTPRPDPPAVVFDCMILLQALANEESASARLLDLVDRAEIALYVSDQTLCELRDVIVSPRSPEIPYASRRRLGSGLRFALRHSPLLNC
jgi:predicted nucleic acid-binding protein